MHSTFIITFIGDDRPGLVEQLSAAIESSGGNWHESRLSQLGGKFAGLVLVSLPEAQAATLEQTLKDLGESGLSVRVTATGETPPSVGGRAITLNVLGPDRPGIVHEIASALARREINVVEMESQVDSAAMSGEMLFRATIDAQVPADSDLAELQENLEAIANQMTLEIDLD
ncbi:ACT domain-containing protein [Mangrovimicrobium sediminis]|uniref:Glycine cleavage system transcriptional repressor n=1 Tax=Mangrovimicrobium sediminis TaxID=2562682 RepID=A0A4Z0M6D2_9GAMM|nr:ACT domain-containing protein [Haliea sp. SAOS-164]TGD75233.1 ACT domain-containing protein [Haliea sp. SAOS-164]